jgi:hypothetical protein
MPTAQWVRNPTVQPRPRLASVEQAALYLGFGAPGRPGHAARPAVRSVWRLIERGELVAVRLPGCRRTMIEWAALDALVDRSRDA